MLFKTEHLLMKSTSKHIKGIITRCTNYKEADRIFTLISDIGCLIISSPPVYFLGSSRKRVKLISALAEGVP